MRLSPKAIANLRDERRETKDERRASRPRFWSIVYRLSPLSLPVIGVIVQYRDRPIKLLGQQHAGETMGQGQRGQRPGEGSGLLDGSGEAVRAAHDERDVLSGLPP